MSFAKSIIHFGAGLIALTTFSVEAAGAVELDWWRAARFGMFIHWGPVALSGREISWSRANSNTNCPNNGDTPVEVYDNLYTQFNPTNFNAADWMRIARTTGMKYTVLTAKHCDGFLLWDSKVDDYNIGATPFRRDICAEVARAARDQHVRLGWYFSPMDWRDPDFRTERNSAFVARMQGELRELLENYGHVDLLWFDWDTWKAAYDQENTYALVRKLQPGIVINNRLDLGLGDSNKDIKSPNANYYTPEQHVGAYDDQRPWETCMTLGTQWSWKPEDKIKTPAEVISILARTAGGDGNLLLNVGPMPDGRIEPRQVKVLEQVGRWMDSNGESIHGTRGGPWKPNREIASTRKGNVAYLHVLRAESGIIELPMLARSIVSAAVLGGHDIKFSQKDGKLLIRLPETLRKPLATVIKLILAGSAMDLPALEIPAEIEAKASHVFENQASTYGAAAAFDGDEETRWATDNGTRQAWISAALNSPRPVSGVTIREAYANRVQKFEFQYFDGADWKTLFTGTTLGTHFQRHFTPVTAREFRLNILAASEGPTISEIELSGD